MTTPSVTTAPQPSDRWRALVLAWLYGASGACALMHEALWARLLGLTLGHTTYAATVVVAAFMAGLALGALGEQNSRSL
jgi:predicted membrane-bound spermidine synthase